MEGKEQKRRGNIISTYIQPLTLVVCLMEVNFLLNSLVSLLWKITYIMINRMYLITWSFAI